jgi:hypothetical protein
MNPDDSREAATGDGINQVDSRMSATGVGTCSDEWFMTTGLWLRHFQRFSVEITYVAAGREFGGLPE